MITEEGEGKGRETECIRMKGKEQKNLKERGKPKIRNIHHDTKILNK